MITAIKNEITQIKSKGMVIVIIGAVVMQSIVVFAESSADNLPDTYKLDSLIKEALANNPETLALKKKHEASLSKIPQAKSLDDPMFGLEFEQVQRGRLNLGKADMKMYSVSQMVPFPGKLSAKGRIALAESQMVASEYRDKQTKLIKEVKTAYYELYMKQKDIGLTGAIKDILSQVIKVAETKYIFGRAEQAEVLKAQVEHAQLANKLLILEQEKSAVQVNMNALLNRDVNTKISDITEIEPSNSNAGLEQGQSDFDYGLDDLYIIALEQKPELAMFRYAIERAGAEHTLSKKSFLPDLTGMFTLRDPLTGSFGAYDLLMAINIPVWAWTKQRYAVKEAFANLEQARLGYKAIENATLSEVKALYVETENTKRTVELYKTTILPLSDETLKASLVSYQTDKTDFLMVLDNLKMLYDNKMEYYKALVDFEETRADLERAVGRPL